MKTQSKFKELNDWIENNPIEFQIELSQISNKIQVEKDKVPVELDNLPYYNNIIHLNEYDVYLGERVFGQYYQATIFHIIDNTTGSIILSSETNEIQALIEEELIKPGFINFISIYGNYKINEIDRLN